MILKIFLTGVSVLFFAVVANLAAASLNITTWYGLVEEIDDSGFLQALKAQSVASLLFLFVIYPFILGAAGYFVFYWLE